MSQFALPVLFGLFIWWFSTGAVLYLVRANGVKIPWTTAGATIVLAAAAWGLAAGSQTTTVAGAYLAFSGAILVWGWAEITFLSGLLTGPRARPCPQDVTGWRRAGHALNAILYHELVLLALAAMIIAVTWNGANQAGAATFVVLWTMRLSAKLNLFLGVPILNDEFLPDRLGHLKSFFTRGPINFLFPIAVTGATVVAVWFVVLAVSADSAFATAEFLLLATLLGLAVLEHWFMVVPLPVKALWEWGLGAPPRAEIVPDELPRSHPAAARGTFGSPKGACADVVEGRAAQGPASPAKYRIGDRRDAPNSEHLVTASEAGAGAIPKPAMATIWRHP